SRVSRSRYRMLSSAMAIAHGMRAIRRVPRPGGLSMSSVPSRAARWSMRLERPPEAAGLAPADAVVAYLDDRLGRGGADGAGWLASLLARFASAWRPRSRRQLRSAREPVPTPRRSARRV